MLGFAAQNGIEAIINLKDTINYNVIAIPVAALALLHPIIAGGAMALAAVVLVVPLVIFTGIDRGWF